MKLVDYLKDINEGIHFEISSNLGYVITPNILRRCLRVKQEEKLLLFEIFSHYSDEKGFAFPTQQTLALYLGISPPQVSKHLLSLEEKVFIRSRGGKGRNKIYFPSFELHRNHYILLSEWFFFAIRIFRKELCDYGGEWANKVLQLINVSRSDEFTEKDHYGKFLLKLKDDVLRHSDEELMHQFLNWLTKLVKQLTGRSITVDWGKEISIYKERVKELEKDRKKRTRKSKPSLSNSSNDLDSQYDFFSS